MFCRKATMKVKSLIKDFEDKILQQALAAALNVTTKLRDGINSDAALKIVELTPTDIDNQFRDALIKAIEHSLLVLTETKDCAQLPTANLRLQCYREKLAKLSKNEAFDELRKLAIEIVRQLHRSVNGRSFYNAAFELFYLITKK